MGSLKSIFFDHAGGKTSPFSAGVFIYEWCSPHPKDNPCASVITAKLPLQ
jgi:hypothetical protein